MFIESDWYSGNQSSNGIKAKIKYTFSIMNAVGFSQDIDTFMTRYLIGAIKQSQETMDKD